MCAGYQMTVTNIRTRMVLVRHDERVGDVAYTSKGISARKPEEFSLITLARSISSVAMFPGSSLQTQGSPRKPRERVERISCEATRKSRATTPTAPNPECANAEHANYITATVRRLTRNATDRAQHRSVTVASEREREREPRFITLIAAAECGRD